MKKIGVLSLQGSVAEHMRMLSSLEGIEPCEVRSADEIKHVAGMILPGGESTTLGKLLREFHLLGILSDRINDGMPVWGTCAGMILLAKEIIGEDQAHLGAMDIAVKRNAYGGQLDSFTTRLSVPQVSTDEVPTVFIRAPWVERVWGDARVLASVNERIVAVRQGNMLATSFHPELTTDTSFHRYFAEMIREGDVSQKTMQNTNN